jgi:probable F420-dependent oxidoreductase
MAPYQLAPLETGEYAAAFGRLAEETGFESLWTVEHHVMCVEYESVYPYDPSGRTPFRAEAVQPDPLIWLSYVAAATERILLATGILILPFRNPVILAKTLASLDRLSGGRLLAGIGVGWVREEAEALGVPFDGRGRRTDEYIEVMRTLWREPVASFEGEFVRFDRVVSEPRPLRPGGVRIVVGGHSRAAARRAGRVGDGFYPLGVDAEQLASLRETMTEAAREAGRDPATIEITCVGMPDAGSAAFYQEAGVDRMVVFPTEGDLEKLRRSLDAFRKDVIEPFS